QHYSRTHIVGVDERLNVVGHQQVDRLCDLLDAPVPPFDSQKGFDLLGWESETGNPGWISSHDRIRRNILAHHTSGTDHHPVTQGDAREDQAFMSDPYIVANSDVPLGHRGIRSEVSEIVTKRRIRSQPIGGHVIHAVLTAKKYAAAISDRAELADPQHASGRSGRYVQVPPREPTDLVFTKIRSKIESRPRGQSPRRKPLEPPANPP